MSAAGTAPPSLPTLLQPWRRWLEGFDAEIAAMLGEWLLRLEPLLGNGSARVQAPAPEPDGLGELASRGRYERLLLSEWSLADLAPDEFLRRAANGEHLFLAPTLVRPRSEPRMAVVFDAGPRQWGDPRLVHVAMWILLWRRAESQQARLQWGLAHLPGELHDVDASGQLLQMLRGRTHVVAGETHWEAWRTALQEQGSPIGERWWIGARDSGPALHAFTHAAGIQTGWDAQLQVVIGARGGTRAVGLPRPSAVPASRLLSGEFLSRTTRVEAATAKGRFSMRQPPVFSRNGRSVMMPLAGRNCAFQVRLPEPGQRKSSPGRYHEWAAQSQLVCVVTLDKDVGGITCDADHLYFWKFLGYPTQTRPAPTVFSLRPGVPQWLPAILMHAGRKLRSLAVIDHAQQLVAWIASPGVQPNAPRRIAADVVAMHQTGPKTAIYARSEGSYVGIHHLQADGSTCPRARLLVQKQPRAIWFGGHGREAGFHTCCLEYPAADGRCELVFHDAGCELLESVSLPADWKRVGLIDTGGSGKPWQMLLLRADRRALIAVGAPGQTLIHGASDDIMSVSVSSCGRRIALVTVGGELQVWGLGSDGSDLAALARIRGAGDTHDA